MVNPSWAFYERHFGAPRLRHYLDAASGDRDAAMRLYDWNVDVSSAFWGSLSYFEVGLRNAIDARMTLRQSRLERDTHWIFDDAREFGRDKDGAGKHRYPYQDVDVAKKRILRNGKSIDPGQVISEVSFGFWHQLVSKSHNRFWPDIASAFPHAPDRSQQRVADAVSRLRAFRNRIGHHHRIWPEDLGARYQDILTVAGCIDPELRVQIDGRSTVPALLSGATEVLRPGAKFVSGAG